MLYCFPLGAGATGATRPAPRVCWHQPPAQPVTRLGGGVARAGRAPEGAPAARQTGRYFPNTRLWRHSYCQVSALLTCLRKFPQVAGRSVDSAARSACRGPGGPGQPERGDEGRRPRGHGHQQPGGRNLRGRLRGASPGFTVYSGSVCYFCVCVLVSKERIILAHIILS